MDKWTAEERDDEKLRGKMVDRAEIENERLRQDLGQRKRFADNVLTGVLGWMFFVGMIVVLSATRGPAFRLSDQVLITLLTTTTANVLGLLLIVVTYYFKRR